jgi:hypothetical protein
MQRFMRTLHIQSAVNACKKAWKLEICPSNHHQVHIILEKFIKIFICTNLEGCQDMHAMDNVYSQRQQYVLF